MAITTLGIIGVGLIGGSLGLAAKARGAASRVIGCAPASEHETILASGAVDAVYSDWHELAMSSDIVVIAAPPVTTISLIPQVLDVSEGVVSDVCSVKEPVMGAAARASQPNRFVGAHPMTGSHQRGADAARADLFDGCTVVLTPTEATDAHSRHVIETLWMSVGATVITMSADAHDRAVARVSHGVHALAAVAASLSRDDQTALRLASTGYRDTTRIASSDPDMWAEILLLNAPAICRVLDDAADELAGLRCLLQRGNRADLRAWLSDIKAGRDAWLKGQGRDTR
ncbi:MAG: prephenate dehydrogenase/arogenate dehydrogenase family protein [Phycisphaerales bacterium]|nr:prephenate dehydrogenase/arogenate dehydrogenase family protein [Phycisphaerales bacterium]